MAPREQKPAEDTQAAKRRKAKKVSEKSTGPHPRFCLNHLLAILLDSISDSKDNQPQKLAYIFQDYCDQFPQGSFEFDVSVVSSIKHGSRAPVRFITDFYKTRSQEFGENFYTEVYPKLESPMETAGQFFNVISQSFDPQHRRSLDHFKEKMLSLDLTSYSPRACSDYMAESLYYFMYHQTFALKAGSPALPPDFVLGCKTASPCQYFCGRDDEISKLHTLLLANNHAFVTGLSGIGKSEVARGYAQTYSHNYPAYYKHTFTVPFYGSLRQTIIRIPFSCDEEIRKQYETQRKQLIASFAGNPDGLPMLQEELQRLEQKQSDALFAEHDRLLSTLPPNTLMTIENMNIRSDQDPLLAHVLAYPCHVLITSQDNYSDYAHLELTGIQDPKVLKELVACYWKDAGKNSKKNVEMFSLLHQHTLMVELCAKLLGTGAMRIDDLLAKLRTLRLRLDAEDIIKIRKDSRNISDTFHGFIRMLFPFFHLDQEEQYILTNLALFPAEGIPLTDFKKWIGLTSEGHASDTEQSFRRLCIAAISSLVEKGLIQNRDGVLSMHALIQDVVLAEEEVAPSVQRCHSLLSNLQTICQEFCDNTDYPETVFRVLMNAITLAQKDEDDFYLELMQDAFFAVVFHGYQEGISAISEELSRLLVSPQRILTSPRSQMLHYIKACNAKTTEEERAEYHAIMARFYDLPVEYLLSPQVIPAFKLLIKMGISAFNGLLHEITPERNETLKRTIQKEVHILFHTPDGWKEYTKLMADILDRLLWAAMAVMQGIPSGITVGQIVRIVDPDPL